MPRKKRKYTKRSVISKPEIIEHPTPRQGITAYSRSSFKWAESYVSLLMGVIIIVIAVLFVVTVIRTSHHMEQDTSSIATGPTPTTAPTIQQPNHTKTYTVKQGDDLWTIAQQEYGSGYNWVDIAKANNLSDPGTIFAGNQLIIPQLTKTQITPMPTSELGQLMNQEQLKPIKSDNYTVEHGDTLWDISVRAYADGYRWVDIAKANNLANPDLIHSGNILIIPR
jgi:putative chitinase